MRLCVISDTHIPDRSQSIPAPVIKAIKEADMVVHAGDFTSANVYHQIKTLKPCKAVLGNIDEAELTGLLAAKEVFWCQKFKTGLIHGTGKYDMVLDNVRRQFDETFALVIYGHAHAASCDKIGKTIYFNPGSPTDKIFAPYNSYGIIDIDKKIDIKIIKL
jgi:putative phosphoesterase